MAYENLDVHIYPGIADETSIIGLGNRTAPPIGAALGKLLGEQGYRVTPVPTEELPESFYASDLHCWEVQPPLSRQAANSLNGQTLETDGAKNAVISIFDSRDCLGSLISSARVVAQRRRGDVTCVE